MKLLSQNPQAVHPDFGGSSSQPIIPGAGLSPLVQGMDGDLDRAIYYWHNKLRTDPTELISSLEGFKSRLRDAAQTEIGAIEKALKELKR